MYSLLYLLIIVLISNILTIIFNTFFKEKKATFNLLKTANLNVFTLLSTIT